MWRPSSALTAPSRWCSPISRASCSDRDQRVRPRQGYADAGQAIRAKCGCSHRSAEMRESNSGWQIIAGNREDFACRSPGDSDLFTENVTIVRRQPVLRSTGNIWIRSEPNQAVTSRLDFMQIVRKSRPLVSSPRSPVLFNRVIHRTRAPEFSCLSGPDNSNSAVSAPSSSD